MSDVALVDATTLIALGSVGRVDLLANLDGDLAVPTLVLEEVTTEPARTNVDAFLTDDQRVTRASVSESALDRAAGTLGDERIHGDVMLVATLLDRQDDRSVAVVSDDRRVRTVSGGLGATVTGTIGVVVRAVHEGMNAEEGKALIRDVDSHGLHTTGELREKAYELIDGTTET